MRSKCLLSVLLGVLCIEGEHGGGGGAWLVYGLGEVEELHRFGLNCIGKKRIGNESRVIVIG